LAWGGWDFDTLPINLQDAQFIEAKQYSVQDIGRMLGIPSGLLNDPNAPGGDSPEQENMRLLQHGVAPWMTRLEDALEADADLFPEPDWSVEMDDQGFLRADIQTRWNAYRLGRQGGWITANEVRAREGLPGVGWRRSDPGNAGWRRSERFFDQQQRPGRWRGRCQRQLITVRPSRFRSRRSSSTRPATRKRAAAGTMRGHAAVVNRLSHDMGGFPRQDRARVLHEGARQQPGRASALGSQHAVCPRADPEQQPRAA
jgi:hypothetical protein